MTRQGDRFSQIGVNLPELLLRVENDLDLLCELIGIFKEEFPRLLQCLQDSVTREDMKNVEAASHALKGMLSGLSVTRAAATASRLEQMGRAGTNVGADRCLNTPRKRSGGLVAGVGWHTLQRRNCENSYRRR